MKRTVMSLFLVWSVAIVVSQSTSQIVADVKDTESYGNASDDMPEHINMTIDHEGASHIVHLHRIRHSAVRSSLYLPVEDIKTTPSPNQFWAADRRRRQITTGTTVCVPAPTGPPPCCTLLCKCRRCYERCKNACRKGRYRGFWFWRRRRCCRLSLRCKLLLLCHGPKPDWKYF